MPTKQLKAIQTYYRGFHFRSRTEARWAVFFDALGIKWDYEIEGFELDGTRYLPDFLIHDGNKQYWAEVKGWVFREHEMRKARLLASHTSYPVLLLMCRPECTAYDMLIPEQDGIDEYGVILPCPMTHNRFWFCPSSEEIDSITNDEKYRNAVNASRSARFEYGETPA